MSVTFFGAFFEVPGVLRPGVLRPGVRRPPMLNKRRLGVAGFTFFVNFLQRNRKFVHYGCVRIFLKGKTYDASITHGFRPIFIVFGICTWDLKLADEKAALRLAKWLNRLPGDAALRNQVKNLYFRICKTTEKIQENYIFLTGFLTVFADASNVNELLVSCPMCRSATFMYIASMLSLYLVRL